MLQFKDAKFKGSRAAAAPFRLKLLEVLSTTTDEILLDFTGVPGATQSFIDELIGIAIRERGESVLRRLKFVGCNDDVKAVIRLVAGYSAADHASWRRAQ